MLLPADIDETELIARARGGDLLAFERLVLVHQAPVRAFFAVRLPNANEVEDLAQDVFVIAHRKMGGFTAEGPFGAWLRGIATNVLRNHRRKFRPLPIGGNEELQGILDGSLAPEADGESAVFGALQECLEQVDGPTRQVLVARYVGGETVREIERRTGRGYSALTMQLHRVRSALARCIEDKTATIAQG